MRIIFFLHQTTPPTLAGIVIMKLVTVALFLADNKLPGSLKPLHALIILRFTLQLNPRYVLQIWIGSRTTKNTYSENACFCCDSRQKNEEATTILIGHAAHASPCRIRFYWTWSCMCVWASVYIQPGNASFFRVGRCCACVWDLFTFFPTWCRYFKTTCESKEYSKSLNDDFLFTIITNYVASDEDNNICWWDYRIIIHLVLSTKSNSSE